MEEDEEEVEEEEEESLIGCRCRHLLRRQAGVLSEPVEAVSSAHRAIPSALGGLSVVGLAGLLPLCAAGASYYTCGDGLATVTAAHLAESTPIEVLVAVAWCNLSIDCRS